MHFYFKSFLQFISLTFIISCSAGSNLSAPKLEVLDVYEIPFEMQFQSTEVGGLSGLDYDAKADRYFIISDDRAEMNNARIYEAKIVLKDDKIDTVKFEKVIFLKNRNQKFFSNRDLDPKNSTDPEDVRYNAKNNSLIWSSEGDRIIKKDHNILSDPTIQEISLEGSFLSEYQLPQNLKFTVNDQGPRRNGALEGLSFDKNFKKLYANAEEPLYEDGDRSTTGHGGIIRFFEFDAGTRKNTRQFFYPLDPVARKPNPETGFSVNGVSAILNYKKDQFLVVERSYSVGTEGCTIKIFLYNLKKAQQKLNLEEIAKTKKLVLNMDTLGIFTDNIEGITLGPKLQSGEQTLLLISDNNFSKVQKTQIIILKIK